MKGITLFSPAKLNLYLKVLPKRPDGYHDIRTIFERIDLKDELRFSISTKKEIKIFCDHPDVPTGPKNLVYRVAELIKNRYKITEGVRIWIKKRIPVAAGLAGGSSNAATTLIGLNRLWKLGLTQPQLLELGKMIGSDVPFFLYDTSWARGIQRGDAIYPLQIDRCLWHVLVVPRVRLYAGEVYQTLHTLRTKSGGGNSSSRLKGGKPTVSSAEQGTNVLTKKQYNDNILIHQLKKGSISEVSHLLSNDLEPAAVFLFPRLRYVLDRMKLLVGEKVMVSGSGPSVFGLMETRETAQKIAEVLKKRYSQVFVVRTL